MNWIGHNWTSAIARSIEFARTAFINDFSFAVCCCCDSNASNVRCLKRLDWFNENRLNEIKKSFWLLSCQPVVIFDYEIDDIRINKTMIELNWIDWTMTVIECVALPVCGHFCEDVIRQNTIYKNTRFVCVQSDGCDKSLLFTQADSETLKTNLLLTIHRLLHCVRVMSSTYSTYFLCHSVN